MNTIESFNKCLKYIDKVLDDEIDEKTVSTLSGYSYPLFKRIFSIITGITLSEYIRFRKLTFAAIDLRETNEKVIDIAIKYGYDSPDSFTTAFKKFHGFTPSEIRNGNPFKVFSRLQLKLSITGGNEMNVSIQEKEAFIVAGIKEEHIESKNCPKVWDSLLEKFSQETLINLGSGQSYGMCFETKDSALINYMACFNVKDIDKAKKLGLTIMEIPANNYAIVELNGPIPQSIHEGWKYVMERFFPEQGYQHSGAPDFEVYQEGDMHSKNYKMELWIPIKKLNN